MRLGILSQYYPPEIGAPQARLSELATCFVEHGHEVRVLTAMPNYPRGKIYPGYGGLYRREERGGVQVIRTAVYPTQSMRVYPRMLSYMSFVCSSLAIGAFTLPPLDYLMTESPPLFLGISGFGLSRLKRAARTGHPKWIFNVSDLWPDGAVRLGVVREGAALRMAYALEAFCYRHAWLVTGQSRGILDDIERRFPNVPTHHLSNGVDPDLFHPNVIADRESLGWNNECVVLYAGLHGAAQGLDQVLTAAEIMRGSRNIRVCFVGDGPEKGVLVAKARERGIANVSFLDPLPREAMPSMLAACDVALVSLKADLPGAVPSKIYEAMGAGRPIVLVAEGEPAEIVRRTDSGVVVKPGDCQQLAAVLVELARDPDRRRRLGGNGRRAAETRFHRRKIADAFIDRLEKGLEC